MPLAAPPKALRVCVGGDKLQYTAGDDDVLSRPTAAPPGFDWNSVYGLYLKGKEDARQRAYVKAAEAFRVVPEAGHQLPARPWSSWPRSPTAAPTPPPRSASPATR